MAGFKLQTFSGQAPKVYARLLPDDMAQVAINCRLDSGRLEPWKENSSSSITFATGSISAATKSIYKHSSSVWIASNSEIDVARSPIAEDEFERIYITGGSSGFPQMTTGQIVGNSTYYRLGIPKPADLTSVTLSPAASDNVNTEVPQSRSYIFTYVSYYGEEGVNCDAEAAQVVDVHTDQTVTLDFPPNPSGNYNLLYKRVYRTDANGTYRFVDDVGIEVDTFSDTKLDVNLGEEIPTITFDAPADDDSGDHPEGPMLGLVSMPNGIFAGFAGQTVFFSEAFQPHAYPDEYKLTVKSDIVALAPLNTGLLVLTKEKPAIIQGLDPSSMSMMEVDSSLSCVAKRSVVDMGEFVMYSSPDGLVMATEGGLSLATEKTFTRDQWQEYTPSSIVAFQWEGHYVAFYNNGTESKGFIFDPRGGKNSFVKLDFYATAGFNDLESDSLYLVVGGSLVVFAEGSSNENFTWRGRNSTTPDQSTPLLPK